MTAKLTTLDGSAVEISDDTLAAFRDAIKGRTLLPGDGDYDELVTGPTPALVTDSLVPCPSV